MNSNFNFLKFRDHSYAYEKFILNCFNLVSSEKEIDLNSFSIITVINTNTNTNTNGHIGLNNSAYNANFSVYFQYAEIEYEEEPLNFWRKHFLKVKPLIKRKVVLKFGEIKLAYSFKNSNNYEPKIKIVFYSNYPL